ncbi:MAG: hypothetical protein WD114_04855 [Phycisphaerales bacterium]
MATNEKQKDQKQNTPRQGEAKANTKGKPQAEAKPNKPATRK